MIRPRYSQADQNASPSLAVVQELIRQAVRNQHEWAYPGNPLGRGQQQQSVPMMPFIKAVVTTAITAATSAVNTNTNTAVITYGSGAVQYYYTTNSPDGTSARADFDSDGNGSATVPVLNWYTNSGTINTNTCVWVVPVDSAIWLIAPDCGNFAISNTNG